MHCMTIGDIAEKYGLESDSLRRRLKRLNVKEVGRVGLNDSRGRYGALLYDEDALTREQIYGMSPKRNRMPDIEINRDSPWFRKGITDREKLKELVRHRVSFKAVDGNRIEGILTHADSMVAIVSADGREYANLLLNAEIEELEE